MPNRISFTQADMKNLLALNELMRKMVQSLPKDSLVPAHIAESLIAKTELSDKILNMGVIEK